MDEEKLKKSVKLFLEAIGEDVDREGIKETPTRVARLYKNIFYGYEKGLKVMSSKNRNDPNNVNETIIPITVFKNEEKEMLIRKVNFTSFCEHHVVPFSGVAYVGIIPDKKLLGMNKIDKIVKYFASRLQIQEKMTTQVADWINDNIGALGVIVIIKANHMCAELQGDEGDFTTSAVRGIFLKPDPGKSPKEEFLRLVNLNG